jgi:hypothetical protein
MELTERSGHPVGVVRSVMVSNIMSLDGFYEGPGQNVMALNMNEALDAYNLERIRSAGTVLLGRTSHEGFSSYWPGIADAPADSANRALSDDNRELSRIYNGFEKVVVSDSYSPPLGNPCFRVPADLTLLATRRFEGSDNVLLRYAADRR